MHASTLPSARSDIGEVDLDLQDDRHEDFAEEWQVARGIQSKMKHCRDWENCWPIAGTIEASEASSSDICRDVVPVNRVKG